MTSYLDKQAKMPFSLRTVENVAVAHALNLTKLAIFFGGLLVESNVKTAPNISEP